jgi:hypothetical protein
LIQICQLSATKQFASNVSSQIPNNFTHLQDKNNNFCELATFCNCAKMTNFFVTGPKPILYGLQLNILAISKTNKKTLSKYHHNTFLVFFSLQPHTVLKKIFFDIYFSNSFKLFLIVTVREIPINFICPFHNDNHAQEQP